MTKTNPSIIIWLFSGCLLIFIMVIIGGLTRLTGSGLSMVDWNLVKGIIPPLTPYEWQETFNLYKQYPEYQIKNYNLSLSEFKTIFLATLILLAICSIRYYDNATLFYK